MQHVSFAVRTGCVLLSAAMVFAGVVGCSSKGDKRMTMLGMAVDDSELRRMSPEEANEKIAESWEPGDALELIVLDPRPIEQWREQRIAGARNLQLGDVRAGALLVPTWQHDDLRIAGAKNVDEPRSDRLADYDAILIYGANPSSATPYALAKKLKGLNYTNVYILDGGLHKWRGAGGQVITAPR
jgi:rhodanese-related sulfurtransferase